LGTSKYQKDAFLEYWGRKKENNQGLGGELESRSTYLIELEGRQKLANLQGPGRKKRKKGGKKKTQKVQGEGVGMLGCRGWASIKSSRESGNKPQPNRKGGEGKHFDLDPREEGGEPHLDKIS